MKFAVLGDSDPTSTYNPRTARAFCEGRKANADGILIDANPFTAGIEDGNLAAWNAGHDSYTTSSTAKEYCAV